jgi:hypothetical protein
MAERHVCAECDYCTCQAFALAPDESCFVHGIGDYPPRCVECGRFMRRILFEPPAQAD